MNTVVCQNPKCSRPTTPPALLCAHCDTSMRADLSWLTRNLDDLENGRLNRAHHQRHDTTRTTRATAGTPLREAVMDLLHTDREGNLETTLHAWAQCLGIHVGLRDSLTTTVERIRRAPKLLENPATPIYMMETRTLVRRAQNMIRMMDETRIQWGNCPNPDCKQPLLAPADTDTITCQHCHSVWARQICLKTQADSILNSQTEGTPGELAALLDTLGISVPAATIRSWAYRGKLTASKTTGKYRLADVYRLNRKNDTGILGEGIA